jgi:spore coat protein JB
MNEKQMLYKQIRGIQFSMYDLRLYLDTHPTDATAIALFNKYKMKNDTLVAEFERLYGPFNTNYDTSDNMWQWIKDPWPWEFTAEV